VGGRGDVNKGAGGGEEDGGFDPGKVWRQQLGRWACECRKPGTTLRQSRKTDRKLTHKALIIRKLICIKSNCFKQNAVNYGHLEQTEQRSRNKLVAKVNWP
jgi:hypothetical protein